MLAVLQLAVATVATRVAVDAISWPDVDLPHVTVPGWVPLVLAVAFAIGEVQRRHSRRAKEASGEQPANQPPFDRRPLD